MFGIGVGEMFVIAIIAIVVIGPKQLPDVARTIGKTIAMFKRTSNQLRDQMQEEVRKFQDMAEIKEFRSTVETEMYNIKSQTEEHIQKEIDAEEQRLTAEATRMGAVLSGEGVPGEPVGFISDMMGVTPADPTTIAGAPGNAAHAASDSVAVDASTGAHGSTGASGGNGTNGANGSGHVPAEPATPEAPPSNKLS
jgi:sec-independent protein translocase protein TatA